MLDKTTIPTEKPAPEIIIIKESPLKSFLVDSTTYFLIVAVIGTGWLFDSTAMQWTGFVILAVGALSVMIGKSNKTMTIQKAREYLNELEKNNG